jgi:hypothetical protein
MGSTDRESTCERHPCVGTLESGLSTRSVGFWDLVEVGGYPFRKDATHSLAVTWAYRRERAKRNTKAVSPGIGVANQLGATKRKHCRDRRVFRGLTPVALDPRVFHDYLAIPCGSEEIDSRTLPVDLVGPLEHGYWCDSSSNCVKLRHHQR